MVHLVFISGGFGDCYLVEGKDDKKLHALKVIPKIKLNKPKSKQKVNKN